MKEPPAAKRILNSFTSKIEDFLTRGRGNYRLWRLAQQTLKYRQLDPSQAPVIFFNASTRITGMSLNASFAVLASMGLQLARIPVIHFACQAGMSRCVQGSDRDNPDREHPCRACVAQSRWLYANAPVVSFHYRQEPALANALSNLNVDQLSTFEYPLTLSASNSAAILPLGKLTLPSVRWVLRRCHLVDDTHTRLLFREFMLSAWQVAKEFISLIERTAPQAIVVFNGQFFPEAIVRWIGLQHSIRVITHEVGLQPFTAFFTPGDATAYPLDIPADFELNEKQNARLDAYLEKRLKGQFTMAGIRFWNSISRLDDSFLHRAARFQQIVPVFTNVIFDTSQPHSNAIFSDMFAWLDLTLDLIRKHQKRS